MKLSKHFTLAEAMHSETAERWDIDNEPDDEALENLKWTAENILEPARVHFGRPFRPSSWYRSPAVRCREAQEGRGIH